jgi:hypothetical protein
MTALQKDQVLTQRRKVAFYKKVFGLRMAIFQTGKFPFGYGVPAQRPGEGPQQEGKQGKQFGHHLG